MTAILAIGVGMIMTALAVAIGGLAIEVFLFAMSRCFATGPVYPTTEQATALAVIHFENSENAINTIEWAEKAAA